MNLNNYSELKLYCNERGLTLVPLCDGQPQTVRIGNPSNGRTKDISITRFSTEQILQELKKLKIDCIEELE